MEVVAPKRAAKSREAKMARLSATALVTLVALGAGAAGAHAQQSFPMVCRGGPEMRIVVNHDVDAMGVPGATAMFVYFRPAAVAAGVTAPGPGECVWIDRTLRPGEPSVLWIRSPTIEFSFQVMGDGRIAVDATGHRLNVEGATISPEAANWQYVVDGVMRGQLFTVQVYNADGRVMAITAIGP
jgi:hypothetical protein